MSTICVAFVTDGHATCTQTSVYYTNIWYRRWIEWDDDVLFNCLSLQHVACTHMTHYCRAIKSYHSLLVGPTNRVQCPSTLWPVWWLGYFG